MHKILSPKGNVGLWIYEVWVRNSIWFLRLQVMDVGSGETIELVPYLLVQFHVAFVVHLVLGVALARSFAGTEFDVDVDLAEEANL